MKLLIWKMCIVVISCIFTLSNLHADDTLPLGGRTAGMGGAGIAFGSDSAMPYLNPAGITRVPGNVLSLSLSVYNQAKYTVMDYYVPGSVDTTTPEFGPDYNYDQEYLISSGFVGFPGSLCYFMHLGGGVAHFSIIVPKYERQAFEGDLSLTYTNTGFGGSAEFKFADSIIFQHTEYYIGPGYGVTMGNMRLGASAFVLYRTILKSVDNTSLDTVYVTGTPYYVNSTNNGYGEGNSFSLAPILGLQYDISSSLSLGLSLALPAMHIYGTYKNSFRGQQSYPDQFGVYDVLDIQRGEGEIAYRKPMKFRAGLGYEKTKKWSFALDVEYIFKKNNTVTGDVTYKIWYYENESPLNYYEEDVDSEYGNASALNIYLGGEYYLNPSWVLRAGFFMMPSTTEELDTDSPNDILTFKINRYGISLGFGNITEAGETSYGLLFIYGKGETVADDVFTDLNNPEYTTVDVNHYMIALFVSGAVDFSGM